MQRISLQEFERQPLLPDIKLTHALAQFLVDLIYSCYHRWMWVSGDPVPGIVTCVDLYVDEQVCLALAFGGHIFSTCWLGKEK